MFELALFSGARLNCHGSQIINSCSDPQQSNSCTPSDHLAQYHMLSQIPLTESLFRLQHIYQCFSDYEFCIRLKEDDTFHRKKLSDDMAHLTDRRSGYVPDYSSFVYFWQCNLAIKSWNQSLYVLFSFYCQFVIPYLPWKILMVSSA